MRRLLIYSLVLVLAPAARAADSVVENLNGQRLTYDSLDRMLRAQNLKLQNPAPRVRILAEGLRPLRRPSAKAEPNESGSPPLQFLQEVVLIDDGRGFIQGEGKELGEGENYDLIAAPPLKRSDDPTLLGWVPTQMILKKNRCIRDEDTGITLKAMVVNSRNYLVENDDVPADKKIKPPLIRLAPSETAPDKGAFRFFDFYYVWADTDPEDEKSGYVFLGKQPGYNLGEMSREDFWAKSRLIGWVTKSRLCFWRTREAIQWDDAATVHAGLPAGFQNPKDDLPTRRTKPAVAYETEGEALVAAGKDPGSGAAKIDPTKIVPAAEENPFTGGLPERWEGNWMRYPVLAIRDPGSKKPLPFKVRDGEVLRCVGVIGDVIDPRTGQTIMSARKRQQIDKALQRTANELKFTEILFVIDRTSSQTNRWDEIAGWVKDVCESFRGKAETLKIAFCFYGDAYPQTSREGRVADVQEAVSLNAVIPGDLLNVKLDKAKLDDKLARLVDKKKPMIGGFRPELMFMGLEAGLRQVNWRGNENVRQARKMVILVGDDGNHQLTPDQQTRIIDKIAALCVPKTDDDLDYESPADFYALQTRRPDTNPDDPSAQFKRQTEALAKRIRERSRLARAGVFSIDDKDEFTLAIDRRYAELKGSVDQQTQELEMIRRGQIKTASQIKFDENMRFIDDIIKNQNVTLDEILGGVQAFTICWVWDKHPETRQDQTRPMLLVEKPELDDAIEWLDKLLYSSRNPTLGEVADVLIAIQTNERLDTIRQLGDEQKRAVFRKQVAVGVAFPDQITEALIGNKGAADLNLRQALQKKLCLLQDLRDEIISSYTRINEFDQVNLKRQGDPYRLEGRWARGFKEDFGTLSGAERENLSERKWYWIDLEKEWP